MSNKKKEFSDTITIEKFISMGGHIGHLPIEDVTVINDDGEKIEKTIIKLNKKKGKGYNVTFKNNTPVPFDSDKIFVTVPLVLTLPLSLRGKKI